MVLPIIYSILVIVPKIDLGIEILSLQVFFQPAVKPWPKWGVSLAMRDVSNIKSHPVRMGTLHPIPRVEWMSLFLRVKNICNKSLRSPKVACYKVRFMFLSNIPLFTYIHMSSLKLIKLRCKISFARFLFKNCVFTVKWILSLFIQCQAYYPFVYFTYLL